MTSFALYMAANLYDTLVRADQDFNLAPALATEWSSTPDAKTWTFKLRDGVTFHGGKKLTSKDVAYSITRILNPKLASPALSNISPFLKPAGISAPDPPRSSSSCQRAERVLPADPGRAELRHHPGRHDQLRQAGRHGPFSLTGIPAAREREVRQERRLLAQRAALPRRRSTW